MRAILILPLLIFLGCSSPTEDPADHWVMESIEKSGGDRYNNMDLSFQFRDHFYTAHQKDGMYEYTRTKTDSTGEVRDVLNNEGFYREINDERVSLPDSMAAKYARSVNSVIYFALLPDGLNDPAVIREYLGEKIIGDQTYHKIKVTFEQQGGGEDFEDVFIYWFNAETGFFDYMAYLYHTDGGGVRFREAYNPRTVGGIRFIDFNNYKPRTDLVLENIDDAFMNGDLEKLSVIELKDISVTPL